MSPDRGYVHDVLLARVGRCAQCVSPERFEHGVSSDQKHPIGGVNAKRYPESSQHACLSKGAIASRDFRQFVLRNGEHLGFLWKSSTTG
jgi:hypothetical protein